MRRRKRLRDEALPQPAAKITRTGPVGVAPVAIPEPPTSGEPLPGETRSEMERLLGQDLGGVRVHHDTAAADTAEALGARALTRDKEIYFNRGQYQPRAPGGREILGHELAHVVQTGGQSGKGGDGKFENSGSSLESAARQAAVALREGRPAELRSQPSSAQVLRAEKKDEEAAPTVGVHSFEITPAHGQGTINAGSFSVVFRYQTDSAGGGALILDIPKGVEAALVALGEMAEGDLSIDDPGGSRARSVRIVVAGEPAGVPRLRATFVQGATTYTVMFQLSV